MPKNRSFEASNRVSTETLLLKHCCCCQGKGGRQKGALGRSHHHHHHHHHQHHSLPFSFSVTLHCFTLGQFCQYLFASPLLRHGEKRHRYEDVDVHATR